MDHFHLPPKYIYLHIQSQTLHKSIRKESEAPLGNRNDRCVETPSLVGTQSRDLHLALATLRQGEGIRGRRRPAGREQGVWECHGNSMIRLRDLRSRPQLQDALGNLAEPCTGSQVSGEKVLQRTATRSQETR